MIDLLFATAATVVCSLIVGQLACRLCGVRTWTWMSGPVGLSALMLLALPSLHAPGRMGFAAGVTALLTVAGLIAMVREPALRPPLLGLLAVLPTALLTLIPFAANARVGTIGVGFNNDMASHELLADALRSAHVATVDGLLNYYPLGPHAVSAALGAGLGVPTDLAFAGFTVALPILTATAALALLGDLRPWTRALAVTVTALPYLAASYFAQGAFKELVAMLITLGVVVALGETPARTDRRRFIPIGLMLAGVVAAYSYPGVIWPVLTIGVWCVAMAISPLRRGGVRALVAPIRAAVLPAVFGGSVMLIALAPQLPRIKHFYDWNVAHGIGVNDLGNLAGPLSPFEALGVWLQPDFRFDPVNSGPTTVWLVLVVGALGYAFWWWVRRGDFGAPAALVAVTLIWLAADRGQSPYVVAKALAIASPFVLLLITRALLAPRPAGSRGARRWTPAVVGVLITGAALWSTVGVLRAGQVGPRDHARDLAALAPALHGKSTLFLGIDDFVAEELRGVPVTPTLLGVLQVPLRPEKAWAYGQGFDVDSFPPTVLDAYHYLVVPRDAAASSVPPNFTLVATAGAYRAYRRDGPTGARSTLAESQDGTAVLDCKTPEGRALSRRHGIASVRPFPVRVAAVPMRPGDKQRITLPLTPGTWDLSLRYVSQRPLTLSAPGGPHVRLPAVIDRPGPAWPAGKLTVHQTGDVVVTLTADDPLLSPTNVPTVVPTVLLATRRAPGRTVTLAHACGRWVDFYRLT